jgi:hypothetical protein
MQMDAKLTIKTARVRFIGFARDYKRIAKRQILSGGVCNPSFDGQKRRMK